MNDDSLEEYWDELRSKLIPIMDPTTTDSDRDACMERAVKRAVSSLTREYGKLGEVPLTPELLLQIVRHSIGFAFLLLEVEEKEGRWAARLHRLEVRDGEVCVVFPVKGESRDRTLSLDELFRLAEGSLVVP